MGMLDGILGNVLGAALGGQQQPQGQAMGGNNPLGSILGGLMGGGQGGGANNAAVLMAVMAIVQQMGGIDGILNRFRQNGMGEHADSWVSTGANMQLTPEQAGQALGPGAIGQIANQLGVSHGQASGMVANVLPELINQFTPNGAVPAGANDMLGSLLSQLGGR